jgi:hypothetical protein
MPLSKSSWIRTDRSMRAIHLYTSMFLVPWMVMYAVSDVPLGSVRQCASAFAQRKHGLSRRMATIFAADHP